MTVNPYLQADRLFVILRVDAASGGGATESSVGLLKALWSEAEAEAEVERLNQPGQKHGSVYFWKAVRLERRLAQVGAS